MSRITRTGPDHTWSASMTSMQRERAEAPFEYAPERWYKSLALWLIIPVSCALWLAAGVWLVHYLGVGR